MKNRILFTLLLTSFTMLIYSQSRKPIFLGFQPGITKEQFYDENEFDLNIFPLVVQLPISKRADIRFTTIANYHMGGSTTISDIGVFCIAPIFLKKKEETNTLSEGFYLGPLLGFGRNLQNDHYTTTLGFEPGFMFPTKKRFSLSLGLQLGGSYFNYLYKDNVWRNHFGFKANIGFWLFRDQN